MRLLSVLVLCPNDLSEPSFIFACLCFNVFLCCTYLYVLNEIRVKKKETFFDVIVLNRHEIGIMGKREYFRP